MNTTTYIGIVDGLHTHEVRDDTGAVVGTNASVNPPEGWTLDEATATWVSEAAVM